MGINILYGESFKDLKEACFEQIADHYGKAGADRAVILVPETSKLDIETEFLRETSLHGMMLTEVLSFSRLCHRILGEIGQNTTEYIDEIGQTMMVYRILRDHEDKFVLFKNLCRKPGFVSEILSVMGELNRVQIDGGMLADAIEKIDDPVTAHKAQELSFLMQTYQQELSEQQLSDPQENYTFAAEAIEKLLEMQRDHCLEWPLDRIDWLFGCKIWVLGFARQRNFTPQEMHLIELLSRTGEVTVAVVAVGANSVSSSGESSVSEIFCAGDHTILSLRQLCGEKIPSNEVLPRRKPVFEHLSRCFRQQEAVSYPLKPEQEKTINLLYSMSKREEVTLVAGKIRELVKEKGYRYRDIMVLTTDMDHHLPLMQTIFRQAEIPLFTDDKKPLARTALGRMMLALFNTVIYTNSPLHLMSYLRSGMTGFDPNEVDEFETFMLRRGIKNRRQIFNPNKYKGDENKPFTLFRDKLFKPILDFESRVKKAKTAADFCEAFTKFLELEQIGERTEQVSQELLEKGEEDAATALVKAWNQLLHLQEQIQKAGAGARMDIKGFKEILLSGMNNSYAGTIPSCLDQVRLAPIRPITVQSPKVVFLLGMTADAYPGQTPPEGILKDRDREYLASVFKIPLPSIATDKVIEDQFLTFSLMTLAEDALYLSVPDLPVRESGIVLFLKECISGYTQYSFKTSPTPLDLQVVSSTQAVDILAMHMKAPTTVEPMIERCFVQTYKVFESRETLFARLRTLLETDKISLREITLSEKTILRRYSQPIMMSISQLETYSSCSFSHYVKYLLKCQDRPEYIVAASDAGSMLHRIAQVYVGEFIDACNKAQTEQEIQQIVDQYRKMDHEKATREWMEKIVSAEGQEVFLERGVFASAGRRTCRLAAATMKALFDRMDQESFLPQEIEWEFSIERDNALCIQLPGQPDVCFRGIIDRIDQHDDQFMIVDYKSSNQSVNYDRYYHGLSMQLFAYVAAYNAVYPNKEPRDAGYLQFARPILPYENLPLSKIQENHPNKLLNTYKINGTRLEPQQLLEAGEYTLEKMKERTGELLNGHLQILPRRIQSETLPCEYCEYAGICGFETRTDQGQILSGLPNRKDDNGKKISKAEVFSDVIVQKKQKEGDTQ